MAVTIQADHRTGAVLRTVPGHKDPPHASREPLRHARDIKDVTLRFVAYWVCKVYAINLKMDFQKKYVFNIAS
jgi:hypothetical protein